MALEMIGPMPGCQERIERPCTDGCATGLRPWRPGQTFEVRCDQQMAMRETCHVGCIARAPYAVVLYCGFVALLYVAQRRLQYFPERRRTAPRAVGLPEAEEAVVATADGERVIVWHVPPRPYFSISTAMAVRCAGGMNAFARSSLTAADLSR